MPPSLNTALPTITMSPSDDLEILFPQPVTFTCVVEGIPTPTVTWYHNGGNPHGVTSGSGSINTLTISTPVEEDTGMYQCIAENVVGKVQRYWALQVRAPSEGITHIHTHLQAHVYPHR